MWNFSGCNIINPDEPIPYYITIDSFDVQSTNPGYHGSVSENISDAWVYVNNFNVGNFQLPATIPIVLEDDSASVSVFGGIKNNGQSASRRRYPFYEPYGVQLGQSNTTQHIIPKIKYRDSMDFKLVEDFETGNSFVPYTTASPDTGLDRTNDPAYLFEGANSGLIFLDGIRRDSRVITVQNFQFNQGKEAYMELDYKCDIPFTVQIQLVTSASSVIVLDLLSIKARTDWNKIYINLTEIGNTYLGSTVNFMLRTNLTPGQTSGYVSIDNLKIISQ